MRLYSFVNYYLSPLQQGLQTAHCVSEYVNKYPISMKKSFFEDWANNHKTIIICNGGNSLQLNELYSKLQTFSDLYDYPCTKFNEDAQSLNGATTAVSIVLPENIYGSIKIYDTNKSTVPDVYASSSGDIYRPGDEFSVFALIDLVKSYRLA